MIGIVRKTHIAHLADGRQRTQTFGEGQGVGRLHGVACLKRFKTQRLHIGHMRGHIGSKIEDEFRAQGVGKSFGRSVVDDKASDGSGTSRKVLRA